MSTPPETAPTERHGSLEFGDYSALERRSAMFRVISGNLVRELRESGYHGRDLIAFVSQLLEAVTVAGFGGEASGGARPKPEAPRFRADVGTDGAGCHVLTGAQVVLRAPRTDDRTAFERWNADPFVRNSLAPALLSYLIEATGRSPDRERADFVVCERQSSEPIGAVSLHNIDREVQQAELAKVIGESSYRGRGFAHEATSVLLDYGFRVLDLNRVYLRTLGGNLKNVKLNERLGFRFEGVLRDATISEGRRADVVLMGLLRDEFARGAAATDVERSQLEASRS